MSNNSEVTFHGAWGAPPIPRKPPSPQDDVESKPQANRKPNLGEILQTFSENTTAHGVPIIARSKRSVTKLFWLAMFLAMLGVFCWQGTEVIIDFFRFPSTTKVELVTNNDLDFPSVTICNMNRFKRSKIAGTRFDGLIHLDGGLSNDDGDTDYSWWFDWDSDWYDEFMANYAPPGDIDPPVLNNEDGTSTVAGATTPVPTSVSGDGGTASGTMISSSTDSDPNPSTVSTVFGGDGTATTETSGSYTISGTAEYTTASDGTTATTIRTGSGGTTSGGEVTTSDELVSPTATATNTGSLSETTGSGTTESGITGSGTTGSGTTGSGTTGSRTTGSGTTDQTLGFSEPNKQRRTFRSGGPLETTPPTATGTFRRKKRSLRNIRDTTNPDSTVSEVIDEWGSWVREEWNYGETSDTEPFDFEYEQYFDWSGLTEENNWAEFYERSTSPDYSDFIDIVNPTRQELKELGHQAKDLILQCTFDKKACSFKNFSEFQNKEYGNCFTFNQGSSVVTKNSGTQYGLHLTLFLEMPEYVGILSPEAGVRVAIHSNTTPPFPEDDGITIAPGMATNIGIRQVFVERLGRPYNTNECKPFTADSYSRKSCQKTCVQVEMYNRCQCVSDILLENKTKCSYINSTQQKCKQLVEYLGEEKKLHCDCPIACKETTYTKAVSSSDWPSERYEEHLQRRLSENPDTTFAAKIAASEDSTSKNLVRLRVYFEELNYQSIKESSLYTFSNLLGNVGGLLGLYIGVSFLTLAEVLILIVDIGKYVTRKVFSLGKVKPTAVV